jgi:transcriptional regulator with XRE-family HTH domain
MQDVYKRISLTLKSLRKARGWSLDRAASETGVSKAMLGQIEREESSPTIATLWKIASGFHTSFSSFIDEIISSDMAEPIHRAGKTKQLHPHDQNIRVMPIFPYDKKLHFEVFIIELFPGCEHLSPPHKHGVIEHVIVIDGAMEVLVSNVWQPLIKNEGLRFDANQPHGYRNQTDKTACFHDIIHYSEDA